MAVELSAAATVTGGLSKNSFLLFFKKGSVPNDCIVSNYVVFKLKHAGLKQNKLTGTASSFQQKSLECMVGKNGVRLCPDLTQIPVPWPAETGPALTAINYYRARNK